MEVNGYRESRVFVEAAPAFHGSGSEMIEGGGAPNGGVTSDRNLLTLVRNSPKLSTVTLTPCSTHSIRTRFVSFFGRNSSSTLVLVCQGHGNPVVRMGARGQEGNESAESICKFLSSSRLSLSTWNFQWTVEVQVSSSVLRDRLLIIIDY